MGHQEHDIIGRQADGLMQPFSRIGLNQPHCLILEVKRKKCLIGDNLSSHLSLDVIKLCHEENITFVFLPANSTHLTQPLDVAFFRPMKIAWRNILLKWKKTDGKTQASVPKECFPKLLKKLIIDLNQNAKDNILAGFRKTGIWPINENQVLGRLPEENNNENKEDAVEKSVLDILKEMRYGTMNVTESKRKRKLDVIPGRSVGTETEEYVDTEEDNLENTKKIKTTETTTITCIKTKKGKGRGKKTKRRDINGTEEGKIEVADTETMPRIEVADTETMARTEVADIETMPVVFEDITLFGEEVEIPRDDNSQFDDLYLSENLELNQLIDNTIHEEALSKPKALCPEDRREKIKIIANEKLSQEYFITMKNKIPLRLKPVSKNTRLNILKTAIDQPSTSGLKMQTKSRRPSYYKNDSEILKDLMSDSD